MLVKDLQSKSDKFKRVFRQKSSWKASLNQKCQQKPGERKKSLQQSREGSVYLYVEKWVAERRVNALESSIKFRCFQVVKCLKCLFVFVCVYVWWKLTLKGQFPRMRKKWVRCMDGKFENSNSLEDTTGRQIRGAENRTTEDSATGQTWWIALLACGIMILYG